VNALTTTLGARDQAELISRMAEGDGARTIWSRDVLCDACDDAVLCDDVPDGATPSQTATVEEHLAQRAWDNGWRIIDNPGPEQLVPSATGREYRPRTVLCRACFTLITARRT